MKLSVVYTIAAFASSAFAYGYDDGHLYEAREAVLEAREAYFDAVEDYNVLEARGPMDILKNLTPACVCALYLNDLACLFSQHCSLLDSLFIHAVMTLLPS